MMQSSYNHRSYHAASFTKADLDILEWIVMHNLGYGTMNVREQVHTIFKIPLNTVDHSFEKLIKLGIIERIDVDIEGETLTLYPMLPLPFEDEDDELDEIFGTGKVIRIRKLGDFT
ncbi:hypothetical protein H9649_08280 [Sporosarcina sp. Sa2YVA2]|uniref:MarR family transcriptional regulator n=1 Tax=Sporosarcina quadrami TaxID=2762234 RepID=A0ABR8UA12_9BACL|nr:hypothetical protein [Sporosarcina quadrami]MBD7984574.1 hypothetical protein [Sporosarcina quadrami]